MTDAIAPDASSSETPEGKKLIYGGIGAFVATCVLLVLVGPMLVPTVKSDPPHAISETAQAASDGTFQVTLDVSDTLRWVPFDFGQGTKRTTFAESDIAVRRYLLRTSAGAVDLGKVSLADAIVDPNTQWVEDVDVDGAMQNPALGAWYGYSYWTHLLATKGHTYAVRRRHGGVAYLQLLSYYCEPEGTGCLTIRYRIDE